MLHLILKSNGGWKEWHLREEHSLEKPTPSKDD